MNRPSPQCKASNFEGGLRVPGLLHWPQGISKNTNVTTPVVTSDILPTIMEMLGGVKSDNPGWVMDGVSLVPFVSQGGRRLAGERLEGERKERQVSPRREKPIVFSWGGSSGIIDNEWKLLTTPQKGQCDAQPGHDFAKQDKYYLYNVVDDQHELVDRKETDGEVFQRLLKQLNSTLESIVRSQKEETKCFGVVDGAAGTRLLN